MFIASFFLFLSAACSLSPVKDPVWGGSRKEGRKGRKKKRNKRLLGNGENSDKKREKRKIKWPW